MTLGNISPLHYAHNYQGEIITIDSCICLILQKIFTVLQGIRQIYMCRNISMLSGHIIFDCCYCMLVYKLETTSAVHVFIVLMSFLSLKVPYILDFFFA